MHFNSKQSPQPQLSDTSSYSSTDYFDLSVHSIASTVSAITLPAIRSYLSHRPSFNSSQGYSREDLTKSYSTASVSEKSSLDYTVSRSDASTRENSSLDFTTSRSYASTRENSSLDFFASRSYASTRENSSLDFTASRSYASTYRTNTSEFDDNTYQTDHSESYVSDNNSCRKTFSDGESLTENVITQRDDETHENGGKIPFFLPNIGVSSDSLTIPTLPDSLTVPTLPDSPDHSQEDIASTPFPLVH